MNWEGDKTAIQETFERVTEGKNKAPVKHRRQYETAGGDWRTVFYAIFTDWKGKRRKFPLRSELKAAKDGLTIYEACNIRREEFDADKVKPNEGMTVAKWADRYLKFEEIKTKRSFTRERDLVATIKRLLGSVLLTEIKREHLFTYRSQRLQERIIRGGKEAVKTVSLGTVANELSCLRHILNKAREADIETAAPSFAGLIQRSPPDRILEPKEETALIEAYPAWLKRVAVVARTQFVRRRHHPIDPGNDRSTAPRDRTGRRKGKDRSRAARAANRSRA